MRLRLHGRLLVLALALLATGCISTATGEARDLVGDWEGSVVTEAINVGLEMSIIAPGNADAGNWQFIGAGGQVLNSGDLQANIAGGQVTIVLLQGNDPSPEASASLFGEISANGQQIEGQYAPFGPGGHGGFQVTKQP